ncbi:MAG: PAS domain S-box protein [Anaerolineae bacterium]|nr:PAS domain S-box protein [Anaerolineae bacterium]MCB0247082.1 PAS domain S-box protein [Anaerolineae bacterium]
MQSLQLRQRDYLLRISRAMTSRQDLPSLLRLILNSAAEMVGGEVGLLVLRQGDGRLVPQAIFGLSTAKAANLATQLMELPALAARADDPRSLPELSLALVSAAAGVPLRQVVQLPLRIEDEALGAIYVFRSGGLAFGANERQMLQSFADQAAIAVRNLRLYEQATAEKQRLNAIIENSANGVMILTPDRRVEVMNRALAGMTGWAAHEAQGEPCWKVLALENTQGYNLCAVDGVLGDLPGDNSLYVEGDVVRPGGSRLTLGVTFTPLFDGENRLRNIIVNVVDITRFREAEQMKSTFVSVISHELKTPVSLIKGYASTLRRPDASWKPETVRDGLGVIEEEADRLNGLIDNLLDASRIQAGGFRLDFNEVNIERLARRAVDGFRLQSDVHQFTLDFPAELPAVLADEARIRQVIDNLLSNAIKYSPAGGMIRVGAWHDSQGVTVYVADEGIGIPPEEQTRLFESFYRVDSGMRRQTKGTGLGLYLSKAIVEAHNGQIWVRSTPGKGSTFFFTLPEVPGNSTLSASLQESSKRTGDLDSRIS